MDESARRGRLGRLAEHRHAPWFCAAVALLLALPTLGSGFILDDYVHMTMARPDLAGTLHRTPWDFFSFVDSDAYVRQLMEDGAVPWWTNPSLRLSFFRPLSSVWHWLDYRLFAGSPWVMHAESAGLYAITCLVVAALYRRVLGVGVAALLAGVFFAVDDAHAVQIAWLANRHTMLSTLFGAAALLGHDRSRRDGWGPGQGLAALCLALSLLAGESGSSTLAYLVAYALFVDPASPRERLRSLVPAGLVGLAWVVTYKLMGYGASGGGFYLDPLRQPLAFGMAVLVRAPLLALSQIALPPAEQVAALPAGVQAGVAAVGALVVAGFAWLVARLLGPTRPVLFFALGALLSLLPVCATMPAERLLLLVGVGGSGLMGALAARLIERWQERAFGLRALLVITLTIHLVLSAPGLAAKGPLVAHLLGGLLDHAEASLPQGPDLAGKTLVIVNAHDGVMAPDAVVAHRLRTGFLPRAIRQLTIATRGHLDLRRVDDHTLELALSEGLFHEPFSEVYQNRHAPMPPGYQTTVSGMQSTVVASMPDGRPAATRFHFTAPLDDPSLVWLLWNGHGFEPCPPPVTGQTRRIEALEYSKSIGL
jgi:hypothetical protein